MCVDWCVFAIFSVQSTSYNIQFIASICCFSQTLSHAQCNENRTTSPYGMLISHEPTVEMKICSILFSPLDVQGVETIWHCRFTDLLNVSRTICIIEFHQFDDEILDNGHQISAAEPNGALCCSCGRDFMMTKIFDSHSFRINKLLYERFQFGGICDRQRTSPICDYHRCMLCVKLNRIIFIVVAFWGLENHFDLFLIHWI